MTADPLIPLRIIPLGGVGEIGKNMYVYEYGDDIVVVDCGLMFPDEEMYGVDLVIPDITYLKRAAPRPSGPSSSPTPTRTTWARCRTCCPTSRACPSTPRRSPEACWATRSGSTGCTTTRCCRSSRASRRPSAPSGSCPSGSPTRSRTPWAWPSGRRSARWSTRATSSSTRPRWTARRPTSGSWPDWAQEGVLCLLSDSTRAEEPGYTPSERTVGTAMLDIMTPLTGRVIVATFASNIARVQQILDAAAALDRDVAVIGRSMEQNVRVATELGYLTYDAKRLVPKERIAKHSDERLVIITTGAQGEPMAGLAKMASERPPVRGDPPGRHGRSSRRAPSRATRNRWRGPSTTCSSRARTSSTTPSSGRMSRATPARTSCG